MGINAVSAASLLKFVVSKQVIRNAKADGHGKIWRGLHGMTMSALSDKKVIISNDQSMKGPAPVSGRLLIDLNQLATSYSEKPKALLWRI